MLPKSLLSAISFTTVGLLLLTEQVHGQFGPPGAGGDRPDPVDLLLAASSGLSQCYSFDGKNNNRQNPGWGAASAELLRPEGKDYIDGDWNKMKQGPNPRVVSNLLAHETCAAAATNAEQCLNDWYWLWAQMIDHDMTKVPAHVAHGQRGARPPAPSDSDDAKKEKNTDMSIVVPANDPFLAHQKLPLARSKTNENDEQFNLTTAFLDASHIYGTSVEESRKIRSFQNGMLLSTSDGFPPIISARARRDFSDVPTFSELGSPTGKDQFLCADMRCNQHAPMASMQTMFVREHNRIARLLAQSGHPAYRTDEAIFQAARALNIAMLQAVTVNEFLPLTLGAFNIPRYSGYRPTVNPGIANTFATGAFRVPHTMVGCDFKEMTTQGQTLRIVPFATSFFDSTWIRGAPAQPNRPGREQNAYQTVMNALAHNPSTRVDSKVAPGLRSVVFAPSASLTGGVQRPAVAFDLIAADIQRGRDHGLVNYNTLRQRMGWTKAKVMTDITRDAFKHKALSTAYSSIEEVDLFSGMLAEDSLDGGLFGPVTTSVIRDQFTRVRDGDRCWFEAQFTGQLLQIISQTRLKDLVDRNFNSGARSSLFASDQELSIGSSRAGAEAGAAGSPASIFDEELTIAAPSTRDNIVDADEEEPPRGGRSSFISTLSNFATGGRFRDPVRAQSDGRTVAESGDRRSRIERSRQDISSSITVRGLSVPSDSLAAPMRVAGALDDVIGYTCDEKGCTALALDDDPDLTADPEVIAFANRVRAQRRAQRSAEKDFLEKEKEKEKEKLGDRTTAVRTQAMQSTMRANSSDDIDPRFAEVAPGVFLAGQNQMLRPASNRLPPQAVMSSHGQGVNGHNQQNDNGSFSFAFVGNNGQGQHFEQFSTGSNGAAFTFDQHGNVVIANPNGVTAFSPGHGHGTFAVNNNPFNTFSGRNFQTQQVITTRAGTNTPAPGITTNPVRPPLPSVDPLVLVENIFVTPQCRR